jgi:hypothetical protein
MESASFIMKEQIDTPALFLGNPFSNGLLQDCLASHHGQRIDQPARQTPQQRPETTYEVS